MRSKDYYRIMLGKQSVNAEECLKGNFIGAGFLHDVDLTGILPDNWREFNKKYIPVYLQNHPEKSKVTAGLACGALYTISKAMPRGSIVLCPNGSGQYLVGEVTGDYSYNRGENLPHRRPIQWYSGTIDRAEMTQSLKNSTGSIGTVSNITKYAGEIESRDKPIFDSPIN